MTAPSGWHERSARAPAGSDAHGARLPPPRPRQQAAKPSGSKTDAARALVATYDAALSLLRGAGGLVNGVRPELLLDGPDFDRVTEARSAAAAGDAAAEEALEAEWGEVEADFDALSARAWAAVVAQARGGGLCVAARVYAI